ncbi:MAG: hypothetical protein ACKKMW_02055 [Candidatus Nealsonbacteria bacterium]
MNKETKEKVLERVKSLSKLKESLTNKKDKENLSYILDLVLEEIVEKNEEE